MSSDLFDYETSHFRHSSSEMAATNTVDLQQLFSDSNFSPFSHSSSSIDILQPNQNPVDITHSLDHFSPSLLSFSPPSHQFENLSLCQTTHLQIQGKDSAFADGFADFSGLEVKIEEGLMGFDNFYEQNLVPQSSDGSDQNVAKFMQRSYSSSFDEKPGFLFQPRFDSLTETPNFQNPNFGSPEYNFLAGQIRRVCSTGDLHKFGRDVATKRSYSSPLVTESSNSHSLTEETNFKVGRYSAEERKERISKYKAKRTQRNFNKTIKYACRKTLADNRPRIRGRFARNDEHCEIPKPASSCTKEEEEDELWLEGFQGEEDDGTVTARQLANIYGPTQFQYFGF